MRLRAATSGDLEFLGDMLLEAFNWDGEGRLTRDEVMAHDHAARSALYERHGFVVVGRDGNSDAMLLEL